MADQPNDPPLIPASGSPAPGAPPDVAVPLPTAGAIPADGSSPATPEPAAPAADAAVPSPAPVDAAKPALTTDQASLLEQIDKPAAEAKPAEAKPDDVAKPAEAAKPADPAAPEAKPAEAAKPTDAPKPAEALAPIEYKFEWPETITPVPEKVAAFTDILNEGHVAPEVAQKLVALHADTMKSYDDFKLQEQHRVFNDMRKSWNTEILADQVLGGAGHQTAMQAVARARDALVPTEMMSARQHADGSPRLSEFEEFLRITGAGDHPVFHRILHNAARFVDEAPFTPTEITPPPNNGRAPGDKYARLYTNTPRQRT